MGNIYHSQVLLVECKQIVKEEKMLKYIVKDIEISFEEYDKEESDEENSLEEISNKENQIKE